MPRIAVLTTFTIIACASSWARAEEDVYCSPTQRSRESLNDYRLRDTLPQLQWAIADNKKYHMDVDTARMREGEFSARVMGGLDFTLGGWPNHIPALRALIEYNLHGGKTYDYLPAACYFWRARQFVPDDVDVVLAEAYWRWKKNDYTRAKALYQEAVTLAPNSPEAHYNLGLLHFELKEYDAALAQAHAAYDAGYPLPGLRRKLESVGKWQNAPAKTASADGEPAPAR